VTVHSHLRLRVSPGAARAAVVGRHGAAWKVRVAAPAEGGRANEAVVRLLAASLHVPARDVAIVSGHASRDKTISLAGLDVDEAERRLAAASNLQGAGPVSPIDTAEFRELLEEERGRLLHATGRLHAENVESMEDSLGDLTTRGVDNHLGDVATETYDRELEEGLEEGARETLRQIDDALERIANGTYGTCEVDGKPIAEERLRAIPWTARCIEHAR
jgi:uncharacterized protein (TIGR00251 family)